MNLDKMKNIVNTIQAEQNAIIRNIKDKIRRCNQWENI